MRLELVYEAQRSLRSACRFPIFTCCASRQKWPRRHWPSDPRLPNAQSNFSVFRFLSVSLGLSTAFILWTTIDDISTAESADFEAYVFTCQGVRYAGGGHQATQQENCRWEGRVKQVEPLGRWSKHGSWSTPKLPPSSGKRSGEKADKPAWHWQNRRRILGMSCVEVSESSHSTCAKKG